MADHDVDDARDLKWSDPAPASIGTLLTDEPAPLPPGTLKHSWKQRFGARDGFGAPSADRPRRGRRLLIVTLSVVVVLSTVAACGLLLVSAVRDARSAGVQQARASLSAANKRGPRTRIGGNKEESKRDVAIRSCHVSEDGFAAADLVVTNHSDAAADYVVAVDFQNSYGRRAGTGYVTVTNVDPGASSGVLTASSYKTPPKAGLDCQVGQVTRLTY